MEGDRRGSMGAFMEGERRDLNKRNINVPLAYQNKFVNPFEGKRLKTETKTEEQLKHFKNDIQWETSHDAQTDNLPSDNGNQERIQIEI